MNWFELGPFTVFDVETTGMSPVFDRVVEIAARRIDADGSESVFETLVDPVRSIPAAAVAVHHITDDMVAGAPRFGEAARNFLEFSAGSTLVAHNARFDLAFLQEGLARHGMQLWQGKTIDSLRLVKRCYPGLPSYRLQDLRQLLRLDDEAGNDTAHRAGSDVVWTVQVLRLSLDRALRTRANG